MIPRHALRLVIFALAASQMGCESGETDVVKKAKREKITAEARALAAEKTLAEARAVAAEKALAERIALEQRLMAEKRAGAKVQDEKAARVADEQDPVDSFKKLITRTQELLESNVVVSHFVPPPDAYGAPIGREDWRRIRFELEKTAFDVKKTDSLVSPYTATLSFILHTPMVSGFRSKRAAEKGPNDFKPNEFPREWQVEYIYQAEEWQPKHYLVRLAATDRWGDPTGLIYLEPFRRLMEQAAKESHD